MAKNTKAKPKEEIEHVVADNLEAAPVPVEEVVEEKPRLKTDEERMFEKVRITIPVHLKIAGRDLPPGSHIVERHQVDTILEMVNKKQRANLSIFTGNNFLVEKMVGGALKVTQVENLDSKTLIGV